VPFLFVRRPDQAARWGVSLFSTGGPGYSTTANVDSLGYHSPLLRYGPVVLFDQRGTLRAQPCLTCPEVTQAVQRSYRTGQRRDSLVLAATSQCRQRLTRQGVDLSAYSTRESAEDINDLRLALGLDSLNLLGISYSGGLMLAVARQHPEAVRCLVLNSPLPSFVRYEQEALANIDEALNQVFARGEIDTVAHPAYRQLGRRFRAYFTALSGQRFALPALSVTLGEPAQPALTYSKSELLDALLSRLTAEQVATVPDVVVEMLAGHHARYGREQVDAALAGEPALALGMRYSVYCAEQLADVNPDVLARQQAQRPWLAGYVFNNVTLATCACWAVPAAVARRPVPLGVPALLAAGELDPWCRPAYNQLLKRYLPHSQLLHWANRGHAPGFATEQLDYVALFLAHPHHPLPAPPAAAALRLE
jgi:pimeloyl-ACP methyl ester carboxylesterase